MPKDLIEDIKKQVPIDSQVTFTLQTGEEISGVFAGITRESIILDTRDGERTLPLERIADFQIGSPQLPRDLIHFKEQTSEKLVEIKNKFDIGIKESTIELEPLDLTDIVFPGQELPGWEKKSLAGGTSISGMWLEIKQKYEEAQNANELSSEFNRIHQIIKEFKPLVELFQTSPTLKRVLAYFYSISENWDEALQNYQEAAIQSEEVNDWINVVALALQLGKEELACYSLGKFFHRTSIINQQEAWFVYVNLLEKFNNFPAFSELCNMEEYKIGEDEIAFLLETAIYLLKKTGNAEWATELSKRYSSKESPAESLESLLREISQRFDGEPTQSYLRFSKDFENFALDSKRKLDKLSSELDAPSVPESLSGLGMTQLYKKANRYYKTGDLELAKFCYQQCIEQIRKFGTSSSEYLILDSSIKKLTIVLVRLDQSEEAASILEEYRQIVVDDPNITDNNKQALDNLLANVCEHTNRHTEEISLTEFAKFFLKRCEFEGLASNMLVQNVHNGKYIGLDEDVQRHIKKLRSVTKVGGVFSPRERSRFSLSAARIYLDRGNNQNLFFQQLCLSFASRGEMAVDNTDLDAARAWYCEALRAYDEAKTLDSNNEIGFLVDEANASLVRYLYSILGINQIPRPPQIPSIDKAVVDLISVEEKKGFDAIVYLISNSQYASDQILGSLYRDRSLQTKALDYLKNNEISIPRSLEDSEGFIISWDRLKRTHREESDKILTKLELRGFTLATHWLTEKIALAKEIIPKLIFELDRQRVEVLVKALERASVLCQQEEFTIQENLCYEIDRSCQTLCEEIEGKPTKLSVENVYPIIKIIQDEVKAHLQQLQEQSKPDVKLDLLVESYTPDNDQKIPVRVEVSNKKGRNPAEALELVIQNDETYFIITEPNVGDKFLSGGEKRSLTVPLQLTSKALEEEAFTLNISAKYLSRTRDPEFSDIHSFSITLDSEEQFENIPNLYNKGTGIVEDPKMFFGRKELIDKIVERIQNDRGHSECVLIYGQRRSGKSSILYHLESDLKKQSEDLLILNLGDIRVYWTMMVLRYKTFSRRFC